MFLLMLKHNLMWQYYAMGGIDGSLFMPKVATMTQFSTTATIGLALRSVTSRNSQPHSAPWGPISQDWFIASMIQSGPPREPQGERPASQPDRGKLSNSFVARHLNNGPHDFNYVTLPQ